jgi:hypothetical protein
MFFFIHYLLLAVHFGNIILNFIYLYVCKYMQIQSEEKVRQWKLEVLKTHFYSLRLALRLILRGWPYRRLQSWTFDELDVRSPSIVLDYSPSECGLSDFYNWLPLDGWSEKSTGSLLRDNSFCFMSIKRMHGHSRYWTTRSWHPKLFLISLRTLSIHY